MENQILEITIKNIKGTQNKSIKFDCLIPNKINIVVGRNGSGKSTFVKALSYLNGKFQLKDEDIYDDDILNNPPSVEIDYKNNNKSEQYIATIESNSIREKFNFNVINSPIYAKDISQNFGGFNSNKAKLAVRECEIIKVKKRDDFNYSIKTIKNYFDNDWKKCLNNLSELFESETFLLEYIEMLDKLDGSRVNLHVDNMIAYVEKCGNRTADEIKSYLTGTANLNEFFQKQTINDLYLLLKKEKGNANDADIVFDIIQLQKYKYDKNELKKHLAFLTNKKQVESINEIFNSLNTTNRRITKVSKDVLMLSLPEANKVSNGERDLMYFIARMLHLMYNPFKTKLNVIVIDEIFDYLDGANLLAFQYFMSSLINDCKKYNYKYYFILFTHLDPNYFNNFILNKNVKVSYFDTPLLSEESCYERMLYNRDDCANKDLFSKYYLHYHPDDYTPTNDMLCDYEKEFVEEYPNSKLFIQSCIIEYNKYMNSEKYNIFMLCTLVRIASEKLIYSLLDYDSRKQFLDKHGKNKIAYAEEKIEIPDIVYFVKTFYNEAEHIKKESVDSLKNKLYLRINTLAVKKIIKEIIEISQIIQNI